MADMDADTGEAGAAGMDMGSLQGGSPPPDARDPHAYADGVTFTRGSARPRLADRQSISAVRVDRLEASRVDGETVMPFDIEAWFGQTYDRAVFKAEGDFEGSDLEKARTEVLWRHAVAPYWDTQLGVRHDSGEGPGRDWLAAGIEGLAPYRIELAVTGYVGESSRTALRLEATHPTLITQRVVIEPRFEASFYGRDDIERGIGSGLSEMALGLRLHYEIRRELSPYIGVEWSNRFGGTEELTRLAGHDPSDARIMIGIRFWH
jgi:copper resistance protein B